MSRSLIGRSLADRIAFMFIHPSKTSKVFAAKSIIVVPSLFATMAWAVVKAGGPNFDKLVVTTVGGSQLGWGFMKALNSTVSNGMSNHTYSKWH